MTVRVSRLDEHKAVCHEYLGKRTCNTPLQPMQNGVLMDGVLAHLKTVHNYSEQQLIDVGKELAKDGWDTGSERL